MSLSGHSKSECISAGKRALKIFFDTCRQYPENFSMQWGEFQNWVAVSDHDSYTFVENFGDSVLVVVDRYDWEVVEEKLKSLANDAEGRLPAFPDGTFQSYDLLHSMVEAVSTVSWRTIKINVSKIASETVSETFSLAKIGLAGVAAYYVIGGLVGIYFLYQAAKRK